MGGRVLGVRTLPLDLPLVDMQGRIWRWGRCPGHIYAYNFSRGIYRKEFVKGGGGRFTCYFSKRFFLQ